MNQTLEEYLRHFCNFNQDDWDDLLPLAQAAVITCIAASTGTSPFFISYGYHLRISDGIELSNDIPSRSRNPIEIA